MIQGDSGHKNSLKVSILSISQFCVLVPFCKHILDVVTVVIVCYAINRVLHSSVTVVIVSPGHPQSQAKEEYHQEYPIL